MAPVSCQKGFKWAGLRYIIHFNLGKVHKLVVCVSVSWVNQRLAAPPIMSKQRISQPPLPVFSNFSFARATHFWIQSIHRIKFSSSFFVCELVMSHRMQGLLAFYS